MFRRRLRRIKGRRRGSASFGKARYVRCICRKETRTERERVFHTLPERIPNFALTKSRLFHDLMLFAYKLNRAREFPPGRSIVRFRTATTKPRPGEEGHPIPPIPMKTNSRSNSPSLPHLFRLFRYVAIAVMALWSQSGTVLGQIYVTNAFANTIGKYGLDGAVVSDSLVTGLDFPFDIAVFGDNIYVTNLSSGIVGKYTTDGATVDASLITGFPGLTALTVADGFLYVVDAVNGTVGK